MKVEKMKWITRSVVRANPNKLFLFGDNCYSSGMGGQAKEMRHEPNTLGIPTKYKPSMREDAFFRDKDFLVTSEYINNAFIRIYKSNFKIVVIPANGIGTGLAELDKRAPRTFAYLTEKLKELEQL